MSSWLHTQSEAKVEVATKSVDMMMHSHYTPTGHMLASTILTDGIRSLIGGTVQQRDMVCQEQYARHVSSTFADL